jgi:hypothetical protein
VTKTLLVVHHTPSPTTRELLEAVLAGANDPEIEPTRLDSGAAGRYEPGVPVARTFICAASPHQ